MYMLNLNSICDRVTHVQDYVMIPSGSTVTVLVFDGFSIFLALRVVNGIGRGVVCKSVGLCMRDGTDCAAKTLGDASGV